MDANDRIHNSDNQSYGVKEIFKAEQILTEYQPEYRTVSDYPCG